MDLHVHYADRGVVISLRELPSACEQRYGAFVYSGALAPASVESVWPLIEDEMADRGFVFMSHDAARTLAKHRHGASAATLGVAAVAALFVVA